MNQSKHINILVGDDHQVIYQGIETMLANNDSVQKLDYAPSIEAIEQSLQQASYDLLLLDLNINGINSLDHVSTFKATDEALKIVIFSSYNNKKLINKATELDTNGYLLKNIDAGDFEAAIEKVLAGETVFAQEQSPISYSNTDTQQYAHLDELSKREKQLVELIITGHNEQELADELFISKNTVRTHKKNIFRKLNVSGTFGLIKYIQANAEVF